MGIILKDLRVMVTMFVPPKPAISLAAINTALKVVAIAAAVVFFVGVPAIMIVATVGHIVAVIPAITITAMLTTAGPVITRPTAQGLVVTDLQLPALI